MAANDELEKGKKLLQDQVEEAGYLDNAYKSMAATLSNMFEDVIDNLSGIDAVGAKVAKSYERDIVGSIKKMAGGLEGSLALVQKINKGQNVSKELNAKIEQLNLRRKLTLEKITRATGLQGHEKEKLRESVIDTFNTEEKNLQSLINQNKENQKAKSLTEVLRENLEGVADKIDKSGTLTEVLKGNFEDVLTPTRLTELSFAFLVDSMLKGSTHINNIQKDLGISYSEARGLAGEVKNAAAASGDLRVTTEGILKANKAINSVFQTAALLNAQTLTSATSILDAQILSEESTSQLAGDAARLGMTFDQSLQTQEDAVNAINSQTGAQISLKTVLEDSNKISGQIRAQLGANPEAIARAVTQSKALGFELEQIAASGEALLNFEQSIEAELQAELLTGKQLNLEKARLAALTGDYETLTAEIAANVGDFNEFSSMNVLQQKAIAESVGMTADQLANSLITEENRAQLLADAVASGNDQAVAQLKAMGAAEKFEKTLSKVQSIIGDIGIAFAPIIDGFAAVVGFIAQSKVGMAALAGVMVTVASLSIASSIANIMASFGMVPFGIGVPIGVAAVAGMLATIGTGIAMMNDGIIGSDGGMIVSGPKGSIQLNKDDSIIAGTNLGGGTNLMNNNQDNSIIKTNLGNNKQEEKFDYNKMASAMSQVQINTSTNYNGFQAKSSHAMRGSYSNDVKYNGSSIA